MAELEQNNLLNEINELMNEKKKKLKWVHLLFLFNGVNLMIYVPLFYDWLRIGPCINFLILKSKVKGNFFVLWVKLIFFYVLIPFTTIMFAFFGSTATENYLRIISCGCFITGIFLISDLAKLFTFFSAGRTFRFINGFSNWTAVMSQLKRSF